MACLAFNIGGIKLGITIDRAKCLVVSGTTACKISSSLKCTCQSSGLIISKLDSTAKGGVVLAICKKYNLPIVAIGMGEKEDDLQPFNAEYFSKALLGIET